MADGVPKSEYPESDMREMKLKEEDNDGDLESITVAKPIKSEHSPPSSRVLSAAGTPIHAKRSSISPVKSGSAMNSPAMKSEQEETVGGDVSLKLEPGKPPKLARTTSHRVEKRPPPIFTHFENKTAEAKATFEPLTECTYANKYLGTTEHALECDCAEEWGKSLPCMVCWQQHT